MPHHTPQFKWEAYAWGLLYLVTAVLVGAALGAVIVGQPELALPCVLGIAYAWVLAFFAYVLASIVGMGDD